MQTNGISEQTILDALRRVPTERWSDVLRYMTNLEKREASKAPPQIENAAEIVDSELIGIWANRTDITSSQDFAHQLRHQAENR